MNTVFIIWFNIENAKLYHNTFLIKYSYLVSYLYCIIIPINVIIVCID